MVGAGEVAALVATGADAWSSACKRCIAAQVHEALQRADKLARNAKRIDYYKVLGVPRTATKAQIKKGASSRARAVVADKRWH